MTSHLDSVVSLRNARLVTSASSDVDLVSLNRRDAELLVGAEQLATYLFEVKPNVTSATHAFESEFSVDFRLRAGNEADVCTFRKTVKCERYQTLCRTKTEVLPVAPHKQLQVRATVCPFFSLFLLFQCLPSLTVHSLSSLSSQAGHDCIVKLLIRKLPTCPHTCIGYVISCDESAFKLRHCGFGTHALNLRSMLLSAAES